MGGRCLFLSFELGETRELRRAAGGEGQLCFAFRRKKFPGPNKADALIFVSSTRSGASVKFLDECKKIPEERENYCFVLHLYHSSECIILH